MPHNHLIAKTKAAGIQGKVITWIMRLLGNREQRVSIGDSHSTWRRVWSGVPQGSVLGPTLFLRYIYIYIYIYYIYIYIHINDLLDNLNSKGKLFADDAKVYRRIKNAQDNALLQEDLNKLHSWSKKWLLIFNQEKCRIMHIGKKNPQNSYTLRGSTLQESRKEKDLGVLVTSSMKVADQGQRQPQQQIRCLGEFVGPSPAWTSKPYQHSIRLWFVHD